MKYRLEERDAMRFVGLKYFVPTNPVTQIPEPEIIPDFWANLSKESFLLLDSLSDGVPESVVGVFGEKHDGGFDYWIASETKKECPKGYGIVEIPPAKWMIIEGKGPLPSTVQKIFRNFYTEFYPNNQKFERCWDIYEIESFTKGDNSSSNYISYGWVPIYEK